MKKVIPVLLLLFAFFACKKDKNTLNDPNNPFYPTSTETVIIFENSTFSGTVLITYTNGTKLSDVFENGIAKFPVSSGSSKVIASIQPQNQSLILFGRKEGDTIRLNYNNGTLLHRVAINGFVPLGTYAEFELVGKNATTLARSYKMDADIDFMNEPWLPIGVSYGSFSGNFDGANHEIQNLNVNTTMHNGIPTALFGNIYSTVPLFITNLTIRSGNIIGNGVSAAIVGSFNSINGVIDNCSNYAAVTGNYYAGGICGVFNRTGSVVRNCKNYGIITGNSNNAGFGGIAGVAQNIDSCHNYGLIKGAIPNPSSSLRIGGIVGECGGRVSNCSNSGNISGGVVVGGICGAGLDGLIIITSFNLGNITIQNTTDIYVGGLLGLQDVTSNATLMSGCYNSGNINSTNSNGTFCYIGGLAGFLQKAKVEYCYSIGEIKITSFPAGSAIGRLVGYGILAPGYGREITVSSCYTKEIVGDAKFGIGAAIQTNGNPDGSNIGCTFFSATAWPNASQSWKIGNGTNGAFWKSLGSWNNGSPTYPKLYYEK